MENDHGEVFVCVECKRTIYRAIKRAPLEPKLCAHCLTWPGWFEIDPVRRILAPEMERPDK
jgi:hypothetical protein